MGRAVPGEAPETTTHRLATLAPYLSMLGAATEHISGALEIAGVPFAGVGTRIGGQVKKMANTTKEGIEAQHQMKVAASKTLVELKDELRNATAALESPLLIVIDDIDRLSSDEVCLLFRLIKANADFPHFIYLILCDRNFVTDALAALAPGRGGEFLEKIVQVGFDVPDPAWEDLVALAQTEWDGIRRASRDAARRAKEQRWQYLIGLAQPYMVNARSARRWMNGVRFAFGFFQRKAGFDANPEDVLGIELLRVFEPRLYLEVARRKRELTSGPWNIDSWGLTDNDKAKMRKSLLEHGHSSRRDAADALLSWLFPNAQWNQRSAQNEELLNGLRVGCHACFDRYFRFAFGAETLSRFEIIHALRSAQSYGSFVTLLRKELASGRLSVLLDHLEAHAADLAASASIVLQASFEVGDQLPDRRWIYAGTGLQAQFLSLAITMLSSIRTQSERVQILLSAINESKGLMVPVLLVRYETGEERRNQCAEARLVTSQEQIEALQAAAAAKLRELQDAPVLCEAESFGFAIACWKLWRGIDEPAQWLRRQLENPGRIWNILRSVATIEQSGGTQTYIGIDVKWLCEFLPLAALDAAVAHVTGDPTDEVQQVLLRLYSKGRQQVLKAEEDSA